MQSSIIFWIYEPTTKIPFLKVVFSSAEKLKKQQFVKIVYCNFKNMVLDLKFVPIMYFNALLTWQILGFLWY